MITSSASSVALDKNNDVSVPFRAIFLFLLSTLVAAVVLEIISTRNDSLHSTLTTLHSLQTNQPTFAIYNKRSSEAHLKHVLKILQQMGYKRTTVDDEWCLLWAHDYPFFQMAERLKNLKPHQSVNHMPGGGYITNKVDLSTSLLSFLPRAFKLPENSDEFLFFAKNHPKSIFVEKDNEHRNIFIRSPNDINLTKSNTFVQEFIQNPFLVDGYKFDIGVYVVLTSVDPLRVYIYTGDVLFRYCMFKYHPLNFSNIESYVVGDDYLPTWEVPSLMKYYSNFKGSMKASFEAYVYNQSLDPSIIWTQIEDIVKRTFLSKEANLAAIINSYKTRNFFDLMRFDFIIDNKLRVYLLEANMSPNLSSEHYKENSLLYEQVLYSALNLVGIGSPLMKSQISNEENEEMIIAEKNLAIDIHLCAQKNCERSCNLEECNLCLPCLSGTEYNILKNAYREHLHKMNMKRIFPEPILSPDNADIEVDMNNMTKKNKWMRRWFYGKCKYDRSWCF